MLSARSARNHRTGQNPVQGLCVSDRDEIYRLQVRIYTQRSSHYLHQSSAGNIQNEWRHFRRSLFRSYSIKINQFYPKISSEKEESKSELEYLPMGSWNRIKKSKEENNLSNCDIYGESSYGNSRLRKNYKLSKKKALTYSKNTGDSLLRSFSESDTLWLS